MFMRKRNTGWGVLGGTLLLAGSAQAAQPQASADLGRPATRAEIARMDLTITPSGSELPPGAGTAAEGARIFKAKCEVCHGPAGRGGVADRLTGGVGTLTAPKPIRTVASYWPYASTVFDYIRRAMPLTAPESLTSNEVYGLVAYLLSVDGIVGKARLDRRHLAKIRMPNRDGFAGLEQADFDGNLKGQH